MRISYWSSDVCSSDLIASSNASYRAKFRIWVVPPVAYRAPYRCHRTACARPRRLDCSRSVIRDPPVVHGLRTPPGRRAPADHDAAFLSGSTFGRLRDVVDPLFSRSPIRGSGGTQSGARGEKWGGTGGRV